MIRHFSITTTSSALSGALLEPTARAQPVGKSLDLKSKVGFANDVSRAQPESRSALRAEDDLCRIQRLKTQPHAHHDIPRPAYNAIAVVAFGFLFLPTESSRVGGLERMA
jgi:hypothetical protein